MSHLGWTGNLAELQEQVTQWTEKNFGSTDSWECLLGLGEEVGELYHAYLKRHQGIRKGEDHNAKIRDAVGDIVIYLIDFCRRENLNFARCIEDTWAEVSERDWIAERKS